MALKLHTNFKWSNAIITHFITLYNYVHNYGHVRCYRQALSLVTRQQMYSSHHCYACKVLFYALAYIIT